MLEYDNIGAYRAGTDVLGMTTKAEPSSDGSSFKINGTKMWITNGTVDGRTTGDVFLVYARTGPGRQDISMFLVEKVRVDSTTHSFYVSHRCETKCCSLAGHCTQARFEERCG